MDSLVEAITELVIKELAAAKGMAGESLPTVTPAAVASSGARILVAPCGEAMPDEVWSTLASSGVRPVVLTWSGFRQEQLPAVASGWSVESRGNGFGRWIGDYRGVCLLGADLPTLGAMAALGAGGTSPVGAGIAALSSGLPVFCEATAFEHLRRHSARLSPGFSRAFEDAWRAVSSFGVEFGQGAELAAYLSAIGGGKAATPAAAKTGGRDVVTTEDVEAVRRAGGKVLAVGMGAIVTPLARQQASEWGIEVKFQ